MRRHPFLSRALGAAAAALCGLFSATLPAPRALAQAAKPAESPPPAKAAPPATMTPAEAITFAEQRREEWRKARTSIYFNDFGEINRYRRANAQLKPPAPGERRVVFFGDSITDMWRIENSFPGKGYLNRGIGGQTTAQMLVRFREDVIGLAPLVVVILAGTNDIAGNSGPMTLEETEANFMSMAELARSAQHSRDSFLRPAGAPLHGALGRDVSSAAAGENCRAQPLAQSYCAANGHTYLDYVPATSDEKGWLKRELAEDGLHPGPAGYALMAALAQAAIDKTLGAAPGAR